MSTIRTISGVFLAVDQAVTLVIPRDSIEVALRIKTNPPADTEPELDIVVLDSSLPGGDTYSRTFELNPDGEALPQTFKKYIGTIPFGPDKQIVHIIEVGQV